MSNKVKDINIEKPKILLFQLHYLIGIERFDLNNIKIDEKS